MAYDTGRRGQPFLAMKRLMSLLCIVGMLFLSCTKETPDAPSEKPDKPTVPDTPDKPDVPDTPTDEIVLTGESSDGKLVFGSEASSAALTFTSTGEWRVTVPSSALSWCKVEPTTGTASPAQVTVTVAANSDYDERNATLSVKTGNAEKKVVVSQKQLDALLVSSSKVEVNEEGGSFSISVEANVPVEYEIPSQYTSWLHDATDSRALTESTYTFSADANESGETRQAEIIFKGGGKTETVNVYQAFLKDILLSEKEKYVAAEGGRFAVELKSNIDFTYTIEEGCTWLHEDVSRAFSSHTLYFVADPYDNVENNRSATITFAPADGEGDSETLTVIQTSPGSLVLGPQTIETSCAGGSYKIEYESNRQMQFSVPQWCKVVESRSMEKHSVTIVVTENTYKTPRSGEIVIKSVDDPSLRQSITVNQEALTYTINRSFNDGDFKDARSHDFEVSVDSPVKFELEPTEPIIKVSNGHFRMPANHSKSSWVKSIILRVNGFPIESVLVFNSRPETPVIENSEISVKANAERTTVTIRTNTDIDCQIASGYDWLSLGNVEKASVGIADDFWTFTFSPNPSESPRSAVVYFSAGDMWSGRVTITQEGKAYDDTGISAEVNIPAGGSLGEELGDKILDVANLTVAGEVDGKDIATIRQMVTEGNLTELDMSGAEIKKDLVTTYPVENVAMFYPAKTTEDDMIGHYLFFNSHLRDIKLPATIKHIGHEAFGGSDIERIELPEGLVTVYESAFHGCSSLRSVSLPSTLTKIEKYTFELCPELEEVKLSEGLRSIDDFAFARDVCYRANSNLRSIVLPSTVEHLGRRCFMSTRINKIVIPASVTSMEDGIFMECRSLNSIKFECSADTLPSRILYNVRNLQEIVFPAGLKVIGEYALDHAGLPNLVIPEGVTTLMKGALNGSGYYNLTLPESLEEIGSFALGYQSRVSSFTIPANVRKIGNRAFDGACYFTSLHIKCKTPPEHDGEIFHGIMGNDFKYENCTLYVPKGSKGAYQADSYWLKFKDIVEE